LMSDKTNTQNKNFRVVIRIKNIPHTKKIKPY
jgi:hypothetical protein